MKGAGISLVLVGDGQTVLLCWAHLEGEAIPLGLDRAPARAVQAPRAHKISALAYKHSEVNTNVFDHPWPSSLQAIFVSVRRIDCSYCDIGAFLSRWWQS